MSVTVLFTFPPFLPAATASSGTAASMLHPVLGARAPMQMSLMAYCQDEWECPGATELGRIGNAA